MKVFVLEDDIKRIEKFRKLLKAHEVTYCDNVETSKQLLKKDAFDIIFFDHDLGGEQMVSSDEPNTGYQLARWCRESNIRFNQVFIHSLNPVGANNIYEEIKNNAREVYQVPFYALSSTIGDEK